jgi:hypothetical protein
MPVPPKKENFEIMRFRPFPRFNLPLKTVAEKQDKEEFTVALNAYGKLVEFTREDITLSEA